MSFQERGEAIIAAHSLDELKLVYRALHTQLREFPELMDTDFVIELQQFLQSKALADGVYVSHHAAWEAWLENAPSPRR